MEQPAQLRWPRLLRLRLQLTTHELTRWRCVSPPGVMHWALLQAHAADKVASVGPQVVLPIRAARLLEHSRLLGGHAGLTCRPRRQTACSREGGRVFALFPCFCTGHAQFWLPLAGKA